MLNQIASGCLRIITQFALKSETFMFELNMNFQMISIVCTIFTLRTAFLCSFSPFVLVLGLILLVFSSKLGSKQARLSNASENGDFSIGCSNFV